MAGDDDKSMSRYDLKLLMDSYKNTIELNTTLLNHQETLIDQQAALLTQSKESYKKLEELVGKIGEHNTATQVLHTDFKTGMSDKRVEETKEHNKISIKLYGVIGSLVLLLGTVLVAVYTRNKAYVAIIDILEKVAESLGVK